MTRAINNKIKLNQIVSVTDFGAVGDGVADDTAAIQAASAHVAGIGGGVVYFPAGTYDYTRLTIRTGVVFQGASSQSTFLVCTDSTTLDSGVSLGSSIRKPDDGERVYRAGFKDLYISGGVAGSGSEQATFQNIIGINLCACERTVIESVSFGGFGQGAIVLARAEAGAEGLGFVNTTHDGNYNTITNVSIGSCGAYNSNTCAIWFKYKANSNKLYAIYGKGLTGTYLVGIPHGNDNNVYGGTLESGGGVAWLGSGVGATGNAFMGIRVEVASFDAYRFDTNASNNIVVGGYHTGVAGLDYNLSANPNNRVLADNTNYLRATQFPPSSSYSTLHNLNALQVTSINGDVAYPLYVKASTTNDSNNYPTQLFYADVTGGATGHVLGRLGWRNGDTTGGAAGVSATIEGVLEDSSGSTGLVFSTGTGTTRSEKFRIRNNGAVVQVLPASAPALTVNSTLTVSLASDTSLRFSVRGSDGVTRTATVTLA